MPSDETTNSSHSDLKPISNLGAVILCGGKSTRLGIDKSQLIFRDKTFLECIIDQVAKVTDHIVLVGDVALDKHRIPSHVLLERDQRPDSGPLEGIRVGLRRLAEKVEFAFVTSCDVPLLKPELIVQLYSQTVSWQAIVPFQGKRIFGMTAIYRTELHEAIDKRIAAHQLRVSDLADAFETHKFDVELLRNSDPNLESLTNINTADDYFEMLNRYGLECPPGISDRLNRLAE
jgi:molybdopterin-guanine dinucleotide biosynthesis protein A